MPVLLGWELLGPRDLLHSAFASLNLCKGYSLCMHQLMLTHQLSYELSALYVEFGCHQIQVSKLSRGMVRGLYGPWKRRLASGNTWQLD